MNMFFAKLINGQLKKAPNPILVNDYWIGNPPDEIYIQEGYKPITYTNSPIVEEGFIAVSSWEEKENEILQVWSIEPEGDISDEDALSILLGE